MQWGGLDGGELARGGEESPELHREMIAKFTAAPFASIVSVACERHGQRLH
jgi:hypothetical protein